MDHIIQYSRDIQKLITDKKELKLELDEKQKEYVILEEELCKLKNNMSNVSNLINKINYNISKSKKINKILGYLSGGLTVALAISLIIFSGEIIVPTIIGYLFSMVILVEIATANHVYKFSANKTLEEKMRLLSEIESDCKDKEIEFINIKNVYNGINSSINAIDEKINFTQRDDEILEAQREDHIKEEVKEDITPKGHKSRRLTINN